jgi:uncharacterized protein YjbI with pentapeptide repeats
MANQNYVEILTQGVKIWNKWRSDNRKVTLNLRGVDLSGYLLDGADFREADLSDAVLCGADLNGANLSDAKISKADLSGTKLILANLSGADLTNSNLTGADLFRADLSWADLSKANLFGANLSKTDLFGAELVTANLRGARLRKADLSEAILVRATFEDADLSMAQALKSNFSLVSLTGACLEDWNINSQTKLDDVECDYIYLKYPNQERRPSDSNRNFEPGEFTKLFQKALSTVDLIFRNGVDWQALLISLEKLRVEAAGAELSIQAIENKDDGAFVVRVNAPPEADKAEVEKFLKREYEVALRVLDEKYRYELKAKDVEIASYRRENTNLMRIVEWNSNRPINVEARATAESQAMAERNINTGGGSYYETINTGGGNYIQGNYINMSQDLTQAAAQIQELLNQLQKTGVTVEVAQEQVATDLANQAKSNPTVMGKLVGWGQTMANKAGETTISEAAKAIVPLALKLVGIPLP